MNNDNNYYKNIMTDMNNLIYGFNKSKKSSQWKSSVQNYDLHILENTEELREKLDNMTYRTSNCSQFTINERGKDRLIRSNSIADKQVRRVLCDKILTHILKKYLIYDNGASIKGKGVSFTRKRIETHLHKFYRKNKSNKGYILLIDFSKFYDNIRHDKMYDVFKKYIDDDYILWLIKDALDGMKIDVSYMTDDEYNEAFYGKYDSLHSIQCNDGVKYIHKSMSIGDQISQISGILFPSRIDNYCKIVKGIKYYGRYMDDIYIISDDKKFLNDILHDIRNIADDMGLFINEKKTSIQPLWKPFKYLQIRYTLTDTGKVIKRINPKTVTRMRRKLKKLSVKVSNGEIDISSVENTYKSWIGSNRKIMSKKQISSMNKLYDELFICHNTKQKDNNELKEKKIKWEKTKV